MNKEILNKIQLESGEQIKEIEEHPDYFITSHGRVLSCKYNKPRWIKPYLQNSGYYMVCLRVDGKSKRKLVHRLVAQAFCDGWSEEHNIVNHLDEERTNNHASNLEWCDIKYNTNYGTGMQRKSQKESKPVAQYTLDNILVKVWPSTREAGRNGYAQGNVASCARGELKTYRGYIWKYI